MSSSTKHLTVLIAFSFCLLSFTGFATQKADSVILYSPYTKISVPPGQSVDYSIDLINKGKEIIDADISLKGLPSSWKYTLKAGAYVIRQVSVLPGDKKVLNLTLAVPVNVNKGSYRFMISAGNLTELPLTIVVSEQGTFKTEFTTDQANMVGNNTSTFTYQATLKNSTADQQLYSLLANAPRGWNVVFRYISKQVTSVEVNANSNASINIEINPPDMIEAGTYKIPILASTSSTSAELALEVVISGSYSMELTTPTGLLSMGITAGDRKNTDLVVRNTGSAALQGIQLTASAPVNWEVTFDPKKIDLIEPGKTAQVTASIKAANKAIAGDYLTNFEARTPEVSSKAQFRISVRTSMLWGWVGILIICSAIGGVYYLFRKYGRR
ncbi:MAG: NEW3 domain-containing protein [Bacteroidales bacterium]